MKDFLKYVLATVTGIILLTVIMGILATISMVGIAASSASSTKVEENQLDERAEENPLSMLSGQISENVGLDDIISSIRKAKENEDIKGIYIEAGIFSSDSPASSHAIREALIDFKKSGKWIVAYADSYEQSSIYVAWPTRCS